MTHTTMNTEELAQARTLLDQFVAARAAYRQAQRADDGSDAAFASFVDAQQHQSRTFSVLYPVVTRLHIAETIYHETLSAEEATLYADMLSAVRAYYGGSLPW